MNYKIKRNKVDYESEIQELGNFLISDRPFFDIFVRAININKNDILIPIEKRFVTAKIIDKSRFDVFKVLWDNFNNAVETKKAKQGDLLEYLITKTKRPLKLTFDNLDYESECKVYEGKSITNISSTDCNLDVVLYDLEKTKVDDYFVYFNNNIEFLECKQDINSFLFRNDKGKVGKETVNKLVMFKEIKTLIGEIDAKYIFPSFVTPGRVQMTYLKQKGYGFIEVVDGNELKDILFN